MIEYQERHSNKHIYIKIIAWILIFTFSWQQITWAGGFSSRNRSLPTFSAPSLQPTFNAPQFSAPAPTFSPNYLLSAQSRHQSLVGNRNLFSGFQRPRLQRPTLNPRFKPPNIDPRHPASGNSEIEQYEYVIR